MRIRNNRTKRTRCARRKYTLKKRRYRHHVGGMAPVEQSATILTPQEQAQIFLYPLEDNFRNNQFFLDSRTPYLNVAL